MKKNKINMMVGILLMIRLLFMIFLPLMDKTEARYAEIARLMAETGNWITPHIDYHIPFWAKPPLSTWLSALSIELFGTNEFAVRLPSLLLSVLIIALIGKYAKSKNFPFLLPGLVLLTIPEFLLHIGVVSTDLALTFCITLTMLSFWEVVNGSQKKYWGYLFFIGLGLGFLAKGPIAAILTLPPIVFWACYTKSFYTSIVSFPWLSGIVTFIVLVLPWYHLAEKNSPGFIDYFIVGEHFKRFFDATWKGDRYGFPKVQPLGIIWVFVFVFLLPWIQVIAAKFIKHGRKLIEDKWTLFLLFWMLWTPLFFTTSKSLIHPYLLPSTVPVALTIVHLWKRIRHGSRLIGIMTICVVLIGLCYSFLFFNGQVENYAKSDKYLIEHIKNDNTFIYHIGPKSYSSQFYSKGTIKVIDMDEVINLPQHAPIFLLMKNKDRKVLPVEVQKHLKFVRDNKHKALFKFIP